MSLLFSLCLLAATPAHAQKETWLTEDSIRAYVQESETLHLKPFPEYLAFIAKTTHDNYQAKLLTIVHKANEAPMQIPMDLNKEKLLQTARAGYDSSQGATIRQLIQEIVISADKKSATVKSTVTITNQKISSEDGLQSTLADMKSTCIDNIVFTPMTGLQVLKSDYVSEMTLKQEQEL